MIKLGTLSDDGGREVTGDGDDDGGGTGQPGVWSGAGAGSTDKGARAITPPAIFYLSLIWLPSFNHPHPQSYGTSHFRRIA